MERTSYPNPAVVTASKNMVNIVGHAGARGWDTTHGMKEIKKGADKTKVCKIYNNIVCEDHVAAFKDRVPPSFGNKVFETPHYLYFTPAGEEMFRNFGVKNPQEMAKDFADALAKVSGAHLSKDDYDAAKAQIATAASHVKKDEIKKAIEIFTKLTKHANELVRPLGSKELASLESNGDARVETAIQTLGTNEEEGKKELKKVAEEYAPLACSKKAADILKLMAEKGR